MRRSLWSLLLSVFLIGECAGLLALLSFSAAGQQDSKAVALPLKPKSVRFAVFGDNGTGGQEQYDVAQQMVRQRTRFPFDFVLMLGDNIYGSDSAADFRRKFEDPYQPMLEAGVKFYATLGNHDNPNQRFYKPFNMDGKRYYSFQKENVEFFALDSTYMDPQQLAWVEKQLSGSSAEWKICYFHHPLYSDGKFHGPDRDLRSRLEPVLAKGGVNLVLAGHEHFYERLKPQQGIYYFIIGNGGQLRYHDLKPSPDTAKGFDTDRGFVLFEIGGDELYFQAVSRTGATVDSGMIRKTAPSTTP
ncbi:MAG TPA: metallophosphoesterase [Bryobacteraceae bacterium]|nr:metallophosphoesterase [Bryobacteraceae bacterium]